MARQRTHVPLNVFLNGRLVGRLSRQRTGAVDFQYAASWLARENALPVSLSLPLRDNRYVGTPVMAVLDNLLPDDDGIRRRLAARVGAVGHDAYSLLAVIGRDCVGALQFLPDGEEPVPSGHVEGCPLSNEEIGSILHNLPETPLGVTREGDLRISIAGVQEKTALLFWKGRWNLPPGSAATTHILKPPIGPKGSLDLSLSVENEFLCMRLTQELGLPTAETEILKFAGQSVLVVKRFDRHWTGDGRLLRLPQEDCCQALSVIPTLKYESDGGPGIRNILDLFKGSDDPDLDRKVFLKAIIVFWLLGATDGHAKNFSIHLGPGGRFRMAPLYDVMSLQPNLDAGQISRNQMKLGLSVGKSRHYRMDTIGLRHFTETAELSGMPGSFVKNVMEELREQMPGAIPRVIESLPPDFPGELVRSITKGMRDRLGRIGTALPFDS